MEASPAKTIHVALYLTKLTQEADSAAPVSAAVYAIALKHQVSGWADSCCDKIVTRILNAAQRVRPRPKQREDLATRAMIKKLFDVLTQSRTLNNLQTITLIVLGFAGKLRRDKLLHICANEVEVTSSYMSVFSGSAKKWPAETWTSSRDKQIAGRYMPSGFGGRITEERWPGRQCTAIWTYSH